MIDRILSRFTRGKENQERCCSRCGGSLPWDVPGIAIYPVEKEVDGYLEATEKGEGFCRMTCFWMHMDEVEMEGEVEVMVHRPQTPEAACRKRFSDLMALRRRGLDAGRRVEGVA
jgi:hypothetical protein